jgi:hypothetical protein
VTTVDRLGGLLAQIRSSLIKRNAKGSATREATSVSPQSRLAPQHSASPESIKASLLSHLSTLDLNVGGDLQRARQLFVELVLVSEFGAHIASDQRFPQMACRVEQAMASDPRISDDLSDLLREIAGTPAQ